VLGGCRARRPKYACVSLGQQATSTSLLGRQLRVVAVGELVCLPLPRIFTVEHAVARKTCASSLPAYPGKPKAPPSASSKPPTRHDVLAALPRATWPRRDRGHNAPSMVCCPPSHAPTITPQILISHPVLAPVPIAGVTDLDPQAL
jgi:hypothetical protein